MLKFNVGDRVGTVVIERGSAGNAFTGEMIRQLGEIMHLAAEQADIVTLAGIGADFTVGCDRQEPKSGSPFDAFRNISALNKAIAEFPGVLITGVRGRAFGLGVGHFANRAQIALVNSAAS
jgi:enoyl-CoA hydratase/carnithine racemase